MSESAKFECKHNGKIFSVSSKLAAVHPIDCINSKYFLIEETWVIKRVCSLESTIENSKCLGLNAFKKRLSYFDDKGSVPEVLMNYQIGGIYNCRC